MKKWVGIGCVGTLLLVCVASFVVVKNIRSLGGLVIERMVASSIEDIGLPEEDAENVRASIDELLEAYKSGEIDSGELKDFAVSLAEDPMLTIGIGVQALRSQVIPEADLPDYEEVAAIRICERFLFGLSEGKITFEDGEDAFAGFESDVSDVFDRHVNAEEVREIVDALQRIVEEKGIPDRAFEPNFGSHMRQQVETVLDR